MCVVTKQNTGKNHKWNTIATPLLDIINLVYNVYCSGDYKYIKLLEMRGLSERKIRPSDGDGNVRQGWKIIKDLTFYIIY